MRWRTLLSVSFTFLFSSAQTALPQNVQPTQTSRPSSQTQKWTNAERTALLGRAQQGQREAQFWLGAAYEQGWFGKADVEEALNWYRKAAAQGDPDAQNALGQMYEAGEGVKQNYALAARWYRKAAERVPNLDGAGQGRNNLGLLYLDGHGVPQDYVQAYKWFRLANADSNIAHAKARMTDAQVVRAEHLAADWKRRHSEDRR